MSIIVKRLVSRANPYLAVLIDDTHAKVKAYVNEKQSVRKDIKAFPSYSTVPI